MMKKINFFPNQEPYRLLLPLGIAAGLSGVCLWVLNLLQIRIEAVSMPHAQIMTGTFMFCFVAGYLLTFLPRLTSTPAALRSEILLTAVLAVGAGITALAEAEKVSFAFSFFGLSWLIWFCRVRIYKSTRRIAPSFLFMGLGLALGWIGALILTWPIHALPDDPILLLARRLYFQGMFLFLVLSEGSRVFPLLIGRRKHLMPSMLESLLVSFIILIGYGLEFSENLIIGGFLKAAGPTWVAARSWGLFSTLSVTSKLGMGLLLSAPLFLAGFWMAWLLPGSAAQWMHLSYIGGFSLMSLMITTRFTLVKGMYDLSLDVNAPGMATIMGFLLLACFFQVLAQMFSTQAVSFQAVAAFFWIVGVVFWSWHYLGELISPQKDR